MPSDLIYREDAKDYARHAMAKGLNVLEYLDDVPAADFRPVVRGKWEDVEVAYVADKTTLPFDHVFSMRCNQCNRYHTEIYIYGKPKEMIHFCPNCGAMMEESK